MKKKVVRGSESLGLNHIVNAMEVGLVARNLDADSEEDRITSHVPEAHSA